MYVFTIPCRGKLRFKQLEYWLREGVAWIERQSYIDDYRILVIEQSDDLRFNLGWNINVGFDLTNNNNKEIDYQYDSEHRYVYQPVDCIPQDSPSFVLGSPFQTLITIPGGAWESASWGDYRLNCSNTIVLITPCWWDNDNLRWAHWGTYYKAIVTGRNAYECINGHSNKYFGWGVEDDDLLLRVGLSEQVKEEHRPVIFDELLNIEQDHGNNWDMFVNIRKEKNVCTSGLNSLSYEVNYVREIQPHIFIVNVSH